MELLLSAVVTVLVQGLKWFNNKFANEEVGQAIVIFWVFALTFIGTGLMAIYQDTFNYLVWQDYVRVFGMAIAYYEIIVKRVLEPAFEKAKSVYKAKFK